MTAARSPRTVELSSPYGELQLDNAGRIENGRRGTICGRMNGQPLVKFEGETAPVEVPVHWLKRLPTLLLLLAFCMVIGARAEVLAQTPRTIGGVPTPAGSSPVPAYPAAAPQIPVTSAPIAGVPVPDSMVRQARQQAEGRFTDMQRGVVGGQVQEAWDKAKPDASIHKAELCQDCGYKVRLREYMVTVIELPRGERIATWDLGDTSNFDVKQRGERRLAVKPFGFGIDTNLLIYGQSGAVYPLYLRAESLNSRNLPDLRFVIDGTVRIEKPSHLTDHDGSDGQDEGPQGGSGYEPAPAGGGRGEGGVVSPKPLSSSHSSSKGKPSAPGVSLAALADAGKAGSGSAPMPGDFVETKPFDPDKLHGWGNYRLWGEGDDLKPETVFRDDYFTYIRFGDKWKDIELPTAYVVVDGFDELVNTRVQGTTLIVESTQRLISLKSGKSYLCVEYRERG